ncbi:hypothetical protein HMPREF9946_01406 [Acetobacteraceae bacterium AT-5844]|nr:hypothetical protein HMPREF9946_01406 [Acetobacteraceae bacterium AT-5844]
MRIYLTIFVVLLVALFWGLPTLIDLRADGVGWLSWTPEAGAPAWTYARRALELLAIVAGLLFLRRAWKQFWRALAD